jgi:hypothetical protein
LKILYDGHYEKKDAEELEEQEDEEHKKRSSENSLYLF